MRRAGRVALAVALTASSARAQAPSGNEPPAATLPPGPPPATTAPEANDQEAERLARILDLAVAESRRDRTTSAIVNGALVAATTAGVIALEVRDDPGARTVGFVLLFDDLLAGAGAFDALFPSPFESLRTGLARRRALRDPDAVALTERDWRNAIRSSRETRRTLAGFDIAVGAIEAAVGMYALLTPASPDFDEQRKSELGALLVTASVPAIADGLYRFLGSSGIENWWDIYQRTRSVSTLAPHFAFAAGPHGASGFVRLAF